MNVTSQNKRLYLCIKSGDFIFSPAQVFLAGKVEAHFWGPWPWSPGHRALLGEVGSKARLCSKGRCSGSVGMPGSVQKGQGGIGCSRGGSLGSTWSRSPATEGSPQLVQTHAQTSGIQKTKQASLASHFRSKTSHTGNPLAKPLATIGSRDSPSQTWLTVLTWGVQWGACGEVSPKTSPLARHQAEARPGTSREPVGMSRCSR